MSTVGRRLATLELVYRRPPEGCAGTGEYCVRRLVVGVGSADPAVPAPAESPCPRCHRPVYEPVIVLVGVDSAPGAERQAVPGSGVHCLGGRGRDGSLPAGAQRGGPSMSDVARGLKALEIIYQRPDPDAFAVRRVAEALRGRFNTQRAWRHLQHEAPRPRSRRPLGRH